MRLARYFSRTLRDVSSDTDLISTQLALRAGLLRPYGSGRFNWMPLGVQIRQRLEMQLAALLGSPHLVQLSAVNTSEEAILALTDLAGFAINSYKQLPQIITTSRHQHADITPRGGLVRLRDYTVHTSLVLADEDNVLAQLCTEIIYEAETWLRDSLELPIWRIEDDFGATSFVYPHPAGDDEILICPDCGYKTLREDAKTIIPVAELAETTQPLVKVETPDCKTIQAVADFIGVPTSQTVKAVFFIHQRPHHSDRFVFAVIRGDLEISEPKLIHALGGIGHLRPANDDEIRAIGAEPGYASPVGLNPDKIYILADQSAMVEGAYVVGANEAGYHFTGAVPHRDFTATAVANFALADEGYVCPACHLGGLEKSTGIVLGSITPYSNHYSELVSAFYLDENGKRQSIVSAGVQWGLERLIMAVIEAHHDDKGLLWPASISPFDVHIVVLAKSDATQQQAESIYQQLQVEGFTCLLDDRKESPGVKFSDADLLGIPLRITVSDRSLDNGGVEVVRRMDGEKNILPLNDLLEWVAMTL